ncbi:serine O-acetyltransferase EpsC [Antarcticirhabdus aurantiaca]|uniref:Serine O-acetyltransferase n=1 Tax=Antarcticirhabdus aurantiaca TaxID=2606717 RepID=A0ACD4NN85_9HYPH|nr:serine O-acetyltransferase EpsC [Antarcticirhabdus aurantiaca]WAJ28115.1 serine O-acetyltransferase [Jeongeuplla avenae]
MPNGQIAIRSEDEAKRPTDILWPRLRREAEEMREAEPALARLASSAVLGQASIEAAMIHRLASRLGGDLSPGLLAQLFAQAMERDGALRRAWRLDLAAVLDRDPAAAAVAEPILHFKGFQGLQAHRFAHRFWREGRRDLALFLADRASEVLQVDIHPAARLGAGVFIDHATGVVIGETAEVGDNVSILQGVLLGANGALRDANGRRHPRIGRGVMIGAGAKILGPVEVGRCSRIGAGSVVTGPVAANTTVAGSPARFLGHSGCAEPARAMDQMVFDVGL